MGLETTDGQDEAGNFALAVQARCDYNLPITTMFPGQNLAEISCGQIKASVERALDAIGPDVVAVPGWGALSSLVALRWCLKAGVPAITMAESTLHDFPRQLWKEQAKARILTLFSAALAGGSPQEQYLIRLGFPPDGIFLGYDVVDNDHFRVHAELARAQAEAVRRELGLPRQYFLAIARFVPKKNLAFLLRCFARFRSLTNTDVRLIILGDGPLRTDLERIAQDLRIRDLVQMPGYQAYNQVPNTTPWQRL
jgi:glycosyltransferase involved in cell wall biosynthesis